MFSTNSGVETHEMRGTRLGRLALLSPFGRDGRASASEGKAVDLGEGEGVGPVPARRLEHFKVVFFGSKTPHLSPLPFSKGRGDKTHACGYLWRPLRREVA
jgi:hypothetical protein